MAFHPSRRLARIRVWLARVIGGRAVFVARAQPVTRHPIASFPCAFVDPPSGPLEVRAVVRLFNVHANGVPEFAVIATPVGSVPEVLQSTAQIARSFGVRHLIVEANGAGSVWVQALSHALAPETVVHDVVTRAANYLQV